MWRRSKSGVDAWGLCAYVELKRWTERRRQNHGCLGGISHHLPWFDQGAQILEPGTGLWRVLLVSEALEPLPGVGLWPSLTGSGEVPVAECGAGGRGTCSGVPGSEPFFFQVLSSMARHPRSSRAWHFVLSAARRDADARAVALAGTTNRGYDSDGQVGTCGKVGMAAPRMGNQRKRCSWARALSMFGGAMLSKALWPGKGHPAFR